MRRAYQRFSEDRGFTSVQFRKIASEVAGEDLSPWFERATASTEEVDYVAALEWFGLRFMATEDPEQQWTLSVREDPTPDQRRNLAAWLAGSAKP